MHNVGKYAVYSRKSKFTGKGESIENQAEMCRDSLKSRYGITDDDIVVFEDEGFTGGNTNRPKFREMMERCRRGEFRMVICYRLDRISRNTSDFVRTYEELRAHGVSFRSVSDDLDDTSPMGKAMMMISSVFAQLERDIIAERIKDNMLALARSGRWLGGNPPTGYRSVETVGSVTADGRVRKAHRLEQIPEEIAKVKLIYSKFLECRSLTAVETYLMQNGVKSKAGNDYSRYAIRTILQNTVYAIADEDSRRYAEENGMQVFGGEESFDGIHGIMAYNKTVQRAGRAMKQKPCSEWVVAVGKHEGIISGSKWVEVQRILGANRKKSYRRQRSNTALLSGILFCAECGSIMRPKLSSRVNKEGERVYDYLCELKEKSRGIKCSIRRINGSELDRLICEEIKKLSEDKEELIRQLKAARKGFSDTFDEHRSEKESLTKKKKQYDTECANLLGVLASAGETAAADRIIARINELHERSAEAEKQVEEHRRLMEKDEMTDEGHRDLADMLASFPKVFDSLDVIKKRDVIRSLVQRIEWDGEFAHVYLAGADIPKPQRECSK